MTIPVTALTKDESELVAMSVESMIYGFENGFLSHKDEDMLQKLKALLKKIMVKNE